MNRLGLRGRYGVSPDTRRFTGGTRQVEGGRRWLADAAGFERWCERLWQAQPRQQAKLPTTTTWPTEATVVAGPHGVARQTPGCIEVKPGDERELAGLKVIVVPAYNINKFRSRGQPFHPRGIGVGYLVHMDGETIYHTRDSDLIPEMRGLQPNVALVPVSGRWVMTAEEAAEAVAATRPPPTSCPPTAGRSRTLRSGC